jgi:hypothetical protein
MPITIPQIEGLRQISTHLYESMKRVVSGVNNLKLSMDTGVTDGTDFARVSTDALPSNDVDPTKPGVLMKGTVPPTWSGAFTYASTTSSITWSWSGLTIFRADGTTTQIANGSLAVGSLAAITTYVFISIGTKRNSRWRSLRVGQGIRPTRKAQKPSPPRSRAAFRSPQAR